MIRTVSLTVIRSLVLYTQHQVYVIQVMLTASQRDQDGSGFIIRIYHDARSSECQNNIGRRNQYKYTSTLLYYRKKNKQLYETQWSRIAQSVKRLATGWTVRGSNPGGGGEIFLTHPDRPWGPLSLLHNGYRIFPGGKVLRLLAFGPSWPLIG